MNIMKKSFSLFNKNTKQVTNNILYEAGFAGRMIELEIILEQDNYNLSQIKTLMSFYTKAVDYFMNIQSDSFIYFNNKIKSLLLKPRVNKLLNKDQNIVIKDDFKIKKKEQNLTLKKKNFYLNKHLSLNNQREQFNKIFQTASSNIQKRLDIHENSIKLQQENFQQKLNKRKKRSKKSIQNSTISKILSQDSIDQNIIEPFKEKKISQNTCIKSFEISPQKSKIQKQKTSHIN